MKVEFAILALVLSSWQTSAPHQPDISFTIQTKKQIFKPGEPIVVLAVLRNQSASDIYVPHAMTPCSGLESHIEFSLVVIKGRAPMHGRVCGMGGGCSHCLPPPEFPIRVRTAWILLHPGEVFGARIDSSVDAPYAPGIYRLQARYVPYELTDSDRAQLETDPIHIVAGAYEAAPVKIIVRR